MEEYTAEKQKFINSLSFFMERKDILRLIDYYNLSQTQEDKDEIARFIASAIRRTERENRHSDKGMDFKTIISVLDLPDLSKRAIDAVIAVSRKDIDHLIETVETLNKNRLLQRRDVYNRIESVLKRTIDLNDQPRGYDTIARLLPSLVYFEDAFKKAAKILYGKPEYRQLFERMENSSGTSAEIKGAITELAIPLRHDSVIRGYLLKNNVARPEKIKT